MDIDALIASYRRYLLASIQAREVGSFGGGLDKMFGATIAEHRVAEEAYIIAELARRGAEVAELKAISQK